MRTVSRCSLRDAARDACVMHHGHTPAHHDYPLLGIYLYILEESVIGQQNETHEAFVGGRGGAPPPGIRSPTALCKEEATGYQARLNAVEWLRADFRPQIFFSRLKTARRVQVKMLFISDIPSYPSRGQAQGRRFCENDTCYDGRFVDF